MSADHTVRKNITPGQTVEIVEKQNQRSGIRTTGEVQNILTPGQIHPRGIKVRLTTARLAGFKRYSPNN